MLSNLRIGPRLALAFGLVLGLLCVMAGVSAWQMGKLAANTAAYSSDLVPSFATQHQVALLVNEERRNEYRHILARDAAAMDRIEAELAANHQAIAAQLDKYEKEDVSDAQDKRRLDVVRADIAAYFKEWDKLRAVSRQTVADPGKMDEAATLATGASRDAFQAVDAAISDWWGYNVQLSDKETAESRDTYAMARIVLAAMPRRSRSAARPRC